MCICGPLGSLIYMGTFKSPYHPTYLLSQPFPSQAIWFVYYLSWLLFLALACCGQYFWFLLLLGNATRDATPALEMLQVECKASTCLVGPSGGCQMGWSIQLPFFFFFFKNKVGIANPDFSNVYQVTTVQQLHSSLIFPICCKFLTRFQVKQKLIINSFCQLISWFCGGMKPWSSVLYHFSESLLMYNEKSFTMII